VSAGTRKLGKEWNERTGEVQFFSATDVVGDAACVLVRERKLYKLNSIYGLKAM